jgi:hypothetical protein
MALKKNVFQKDNCERIVEILQKLLYNTRPLGPVLFDSLCELVSQNLWLGCKGYRNGLLLENTITYITTNSDFIINFTNCGENDSANVVEYLKNLTRDTLKNNPLNYSLKLLLRHIR